MGTELELFESELVTDARWTDRQTDRRTGGEQRWISVPYGADMNTVWRAR